MITPTRDRYASRTDRDAAIVQRHEPVVYDEGQHAQALSPAQLDTYARQGFLVLEDLLPAEQTAALLSEVECLTLDPAIAGREEAVREKDSQAVRSIFRVHALSRMADLLARDARLLNVARQILASEVYVHQSRANLKPGFRGQPFYWHSDFETWHVEDGMPSMRALSCSVMLTDNTAVNGPLMLMPGSHQQFVSCVGRTPQAHYQSSLKQQEYGVPDPVSLRLLAEQGGVTPVIARAGSVVFFDCNTMHGSGSNISPWPRANLFFVYNSVDNALAAPKYGLTPRPEHVATRGAVQALTPVSAGAFMQAA